MPLRISIFLLELQFDHGNVLVSLKLSREKQECSNCPEAKPTFLTLAAHVCTCFLFYSKSSVCPASSQDRYPPLRCILDPQMPMGYFFRYNCSRHYQLSLLNA